MKDPLLEAKANTLNQKEIQKCLNYILIYSTYSYSILKFSI